MSCKDRKYALLRFRNGKLQAYSNCTKMLYEDKNISTKYVRVFDTDSFNNSYENALNKKHELDQKLKKIRKLKDLGFTIPYEGWDVYRLNSKKCPIELINKVDGNNNYEFKLK